jgi:uncharacterized protein YndB with AHSA1/START domain
VAWSTAKCSSSSPTDGSGEEAATGIKSIVTWTLTLTNGGTHVRMEQSGFRPEETGNYQGANYGWQKFIAALERVAAGLQRKRFWYRVIIRCWWPCIGCLRC